MIKSPTSKNLISFLQVALSPKMIAPTPIDLKWNKRKRGDGRCRENET